MQSLMTDEKQCESKVTELSDGEKRRNANLTPWQPGQSGNPAGRPKGDKTITALARKHLEEYARDVAPFRRLAENLNLDDPELTVKDVLAISWLLNAVKGRTGPLQELLNRMDGRVKDGGNIGLDAIESAAKIRDAMQQIDLLELNEVPDPEREAEIENE